MSHFLIPIPMHTSTVIYNANEFVDLMQQLNNHEVVKFVIMCHGLSLVVMAASYIFSDHILGLTHIMQSICVWNCRFFTFRAVCGALCGGGQ